MITRRRQRGRDHRVDDDDNDEEEELLQSLISKKEQMEEEEQPDDKVTSTAKYMLQNGNLPAPTVTLLKGLAQAKNHGDAIRRSSVSCTWQSCPCS